MRSVDEGLQPYQVALSSSVSSTLRTLDQAEIDRANDVLQLMAVGLALDDLTLLTESLRGSSTASMSVQGFSVVYRSIPTERRFEVLELKHSDSRT